MHSCSLPTPLSPENVLPIIQSSRVLDLVCRDCDAGCGDCNISLRAPACTEVMKHTKSTGGKTTIEGLTIDEGYWRATKTSRKVLACYNTDACKGGVTGVVDYCKAGYEGPCEM